MRSRFSEITAALARVSQGDVAADATYDVVRAAMAAKENLGEYVYAALRDLTWRLLTSRNNLVPVVGQWLLLQRHARALAIRHDAASVAIRISVLTELLEQSARFAEFQPVAEVLNRRHVRKLLSILAAEPQPMMRADLAARIGLGDANLSRIFAILVAHDLIHRESDGREARFSITDAGRSLLRGPAESRLSANQIVGLMDQLPIAIGAWTSDGQWAYGNAKMADTLRAISLNTAHPTLNIWRAAFKNVEERRRQIDNSVWLSSMENGEAFVCSEISAGGWIVATVRAAETAALAQGASLPDGSSIKARISSQIREKIQGMRPPSATRMSVL